MPSFKAPLNKIISKLIFLGLLVYIGYNIVLVYQRSESVSNFVFKIWNYVVIKSPDFQLTVGKLFLEIGLLIGSYYLSQFLSKRFVNKILLKTRLDVGARSSILKLSNYLIFVIFIIISLSIAQIPLTAFTFIGGALAIGAGFGSQNMINNFVSGIILQIEKPIKVGDIVQVDGQIGKVEEIGARSTKVLLSNSTHFIIPNSFFLEKHISNWHFKNDLVKSKILVDLSLSQDYELFKNQMSAIFKEIPIKDFSFLILEIKNSGYSVEITIDLRIDSVNKNETESLIKSKIIELYQSKKILLSLPK